MSDAKRQHYKMATGEENPTASGPPTRDRYGRGGSTHGHHGHEGHHKRHGGHEHGHSKDTHGHGHHGHGKMPGK